MSKEKITGILFGTFDIVHEGHLNMFRQAKQNSDYLIAVVARDETVKKVKDRYPKNNEEARKEEVQSKSIIDQAVLGSLEDKFEAIKKYKPDIVFLGYDQIAFTENLKKELESINIHSEIIRLKAFKPEIYKTSLILSKKR